MVEPDLISHYDPKIDLNSENFLTDRKQQHINDRDALSNESQFKQCYCANCNSNSGSFLLISNSNVSPIKNEVCAFISKPRYLCDSNKVSHSKTSNSFLHKITRKLIETWKVICFNRRRYSMKNLSCLIIYVIFTSFYLIKLSFYSKFSAEDKDSTKQFNVSEYGTTTKFHLDGQKFKTTFIYEFISCDIFRRFTNSQTINLLAATSLLPSTLNRLLCLFKLLHKIACDTDLLNRVEQERMLIHESSDNNNNNNNSNNNNNTDGKNEKYREFYEIKNVIQLNVAYLGSLKTTTSGWYELFKNGWHHNHPLNKFDKETNLSLEICLSEGILPSCINLRTKMYSYNMIQFNDCYSKYFKPLAGIDFDRKRNSNFIGQQQANNEGINHIKEMKKDNEIICKELLRHMRIEKFSNMVNIDSGQSIMDYKHLSALNPSGLYDQMARNFASERRREISISESRKSQVNDIDLLNIKVSGNKKSELLVARPIHRLDLNEMAWLLLFILLLYISVILDTIIPCCLAFIVENGIILNQSIWSSSNIQYNSLNFGGSNSMIRWFQISTVQLLFVLSIFDLYSFVSSCLICISRAKYVRLHMKEQRKLCIKIRSESLEKIANFAEDNSGYDDANEYLIEILKKLQACDESGITIKLIGQFKDHFHDPKVAIESFQSNDLNRNMEALIDLSLLVRKELDDLKKFFNVYLDLEITSRVLCSAFSLSALLDQRNAIELLYILFNVIHGTTPIIVTLIMAAFIEHEFRKICNEMSKILVNGTHILTIKNIKQLMTQSNYLEVKSNRSITIAGNFSLSMGSLVTLVGWVATSLVLFRR